MVSQVRGSGPGHIFRVSAGPRTWGDAALSVSVNRGGSGSGWHALLGNYYDLAAFIHDQFCEIVEHVAGLRVGDVAGLELASRGVDLSGDFAVGFYHQFVYASGRGGGGDLRYRIACESAGF